MNEKTFYFQVLFSQHLWRTCIQPSDTASDPRDTAWFRRTACQGQRCGKSCGRSTECRPTLVHRRSSRHSRSRAGYSGHTASGRSRRRWWWLLHPVDTWSPALPTGSTRPTLHHTKIVS